MKEVTIDNLREEADHLIERINRKYGGGSESLLAMVTLADIITANNAAVIVAQNESPQKMIDLIVKGLEKAIEQGVRLGRLSQKLEDLEEGEYGAN